MLWIKAFHIIAMTAWFAGIFYLPRLYVYHANTADKISLNRFKIMERRLYYGIMWPAGLLTGVLGIALLSYGLQAYLHAGWMHIKLLFVVFVWGYHLICGYYLKQFAQDRCVKKDLFFRIFNEIPVIFLTVIVLLVVIKP